MTLYLNISPARRKFKDLLGNANHMLITILVGLSAVERKTIETAPPELHAAWNPKDVIASARRSRVFVLETTLVRSVDALDAYISWLRRTPALIQNVKTQREIDSAGQSVFRKFVALKNNAPALDPLTAALIEVMIAWRNRSVHYLADNEASEEAWNTIKSNKDELHSRFSGLTVEPLEKGFQLNAPPSFKETASFIRATHEAVRQFDEFHIRALDSVSFLPDLIWHAVSTNSQGDVNVTRRRRVQSIWGRDESERKSRVSSFLKNCGLSEEKGDPSAIFDEELVSEVSRYSVRDVFSYIGAGRA